MKKQVNNPYLPEYEYIPDGEPHVFGNRVYIYGSHDHFNGTYFCPGDYVCYSAFVEDLTTWKYEGVIYTRNQDIRITNNNHQLWAPDVVQGKDGRYYLYYCADDELLDIGVAVANEPAGQYQFHGLVKDHLGNTIGTRDGDTIQFDPGVFIDDGVIYLYSGNGPLNNSEVGNVAKDSVVMTLEDDMLTVKSEPKKLLPILGECQGSDFENHEFFEASSIRKINNLYYLVYSSVKQHELCYAVSEYPDRDFKFGGVVISNCDLFPNTQRNTPVNCYGNNHGSIELINGQYYIFYHRHTNRTQFSRQGCAEKIEILEDGTISQVEVTSQGLNGKPLKGQGMYSASMVCNLYGNKTPVMSLIDEMEMNHPFITQSAPDFDVTSNQQPPYQYIANIKNETVIGFKYFEFNDLEQISITACGKGSGVFEIYTDLSEPKITEIEVTDNTEWNIYSAQTTKINGKYPLYFKFVGAGDYKFKQFELR